MKNNVKKTVQVLLVAGFFALVGFGATNIYYQKHYVMIERAEAEDAHSEEVLKEQQFITINKQDYGQFATFFEAYQELYEDHLTKIEPKVLIDGAITGMAEATGDRYTSYTSVDSEEESVQSTLSSTYKGIGAEVSIIDGYAVIVNPYKEAPAAKAGVLPYDRILKVDGKDVVGMDLSSVTSRVKGEEGTEVVLTLQRGKSEPFDLSITRSEITIQTVFQEVIKENGKKIGKIEIASFSEETAEEFKKALDEIEKEKIQGLVIDVRNNGGGYLDAVQEITSTLLPIGTTVLKTEDKSGRQNSVRTTGLIKDKKEYPIVLLVNEASASAAEVLAGTMRESGDYLLIGTKTFGKGTIQELRQLGDESELKMTVAKWLTPNGTWVHEKGIEPDVDVEENNLLKIPSLQLEKDTVLSIGDVSEQIHHAQQLLNFIGYSIENTNGYFDEVTETAIKEFQTENELEVTGTLNHETVFALNQTLIEMRDDSKYDEQLKKALEIVSK